MSSTSPQEGRPLPADLGDAITAAGTLGPMVPAIQAAAADCETVCLVGGTVRDLLLGRPALDIDIAIEGDSLGFAGDLADRLAGELIVHDRFQTATVRARSQDGSPFELDLAATRTERYPEPGALPDVEAAGLRQDLERRDFTINAIAASLKPEDFGRLHDPCGGLGDLESGSVRVLHERSFSDDPTRLLRAVRYAARLGFELEPETLELALAACRSGLIGDLASPRVRDELLDLLGEPRAVEALASMERLGLDRALNPGLSAGAPARTLVGRLVAAGAAADAGLAALAAVCLGTDGAALSAWLDRVQFAAAERDAVVDAVTSAERVAAELDAAQMARSRLRRVLDGRAPETLSLAAAIDPAVAGSISLYRSELEHVALEIGGDDLVAEGAEPGPGIGRALRATLDLKLDGRVAGREQELAAALDLLRSGSQ